MPFNHFILCLSLLLMPSIFPNISGFSNELALGISWPKDWSFSVNVSPSNEHRGLISFKIGWLDLLAVQETFNSLLQHHSSKTSILQCSALFRLQISQNTTPTGKLCGSLERAWREPLTSVSSAIYFLVVSVRE